MGRFFQAIDLPWHYLPVWIGITTPLLVICSFFPGIVSWIFLFKREFRTRITKINIQELFFEPGKLDWTIVISSFLVPIMAIYFFRSALYDGWRHMFFIYPSMVLICVLGLRNVYDRIKNIHYKNHILKILFSMVVIAGIAEPVWFMARYHPHENVYFNLLAGDPATLRNRFELDYWGLSYKQAIDYILLNDSRNKIKIFVANPPGSDYIDNGLPSSQKARLVTVRELAEADYIVTEFRGHPQDYRYKTEFFSIIVRGTKIMAVYRLP
jgi:hypothetical protein